MNSTSFDTAVIGGGLAGLAAAAYVARAGRSVIVLERSSRLGGRATTEERGGYYFNLGPHALYRRGHGAAVLRDLGVEFSGGEPPQAGYAARGGRLHKLPANALGLLSTTLLGPAAKLEFGRIFATFRRIKTEEADGASLEDWLREHVIHPDVRELFRALIRLAMYANDPARLSAGAAIAQLQLAQKGNVRYLDHGWQTLVDGLQAKAEEAGARIRTGARVATLDQSGDGHTVRLNDGTAVPAGTVIVATPPSVAAGLIGQPAAAIREEAAAAGPVRAATLDVGLSAVPRPEARFVLGIDQPTYLSIHSRVGRLAPEGGAMIHVAKYLGSDTTAPQSVERELEALLDLAQPGWRDLLVERRFLPNLTVVNALVTAEQGGLPGRPPVEVAGVRGLYLAGDWVGREGWLADAALASARRAAAVALETLAAPVLVGAGSGVA